MAVTWSNNSGKLLVESDILPACHVESFETYRRPLDLQAVEEVSSLLQHMTINSQLSIQDENDHPSPTIGREQLIGEFVALQHQAQKDPAGLAGLLNNWLDIEDDNLLRPEEVEIALEQEKVQPAIEETLETDLSSSTEMVLPEDSPDPDSEVQPLTRMEALNSVNITEGIEMVKKVIQTMAVLVKMKLLTWSLGYITNA